MDITIILLIVNVFAAVAVIGLTLIQQPKGDMGSAFGGGGSQSMFGSRGSANFLTKSTSWMCFLFFASSLTLAYMYAQQNTDEGVVDQSVLEETNTSSLPAIPSSTTESNDSDAAATSSLPEIPVDEAAGVVDTAIESGAEEVTEAINAVENSVEEATSEIESKIQEATDIVEEEVNQ